MKKFSALICVILSFILFSPSLSIAADPIQGILDPARMDVYSVTVRGGVTTKIWAFGTTLGSPKGGNLDCYIGVPEGALADKDEDPESNVCLLIVSPKEETVFRLAILNRGTKAVAYRVSDE